MNGVTRLDPACVEVLGGDDAEKARYIESDFRIRSGLCPNGCGLLAPCDCGQECARCGFTTNRPAELPRQ